MFLKQKPGEQQQPPRANFHFGRLSFCSHSDNCEQISFLCFDNLLDLYVVHRQPKFNHRAALLNWVDNCPVRSVSIWLYCSQWLEHMDNCVWTFMSELKTSRSWNVEVATVRGQWKYTGTCDTVALEHEERKWSTGYYQTTRSQQMKFGCLCVSKCG